LVLSKRAIKKITLGIRVGESWARERSTRPVGRLPNGLGSLREVAISVIAGLDPHKRRKNASSQDEKSGVLSAALKGLHQDEALPAEGGKAMLARLEESKAPK